MYCRLPVSGKEISLRLPTGREDARLCEWRAADTLHAQALLDAVTQWLPAEVAAPWRELPVTDLEWALLSMRRSLLGDLVRTETGCTQAGCGAKVDISFGISEYLAQFSICRPPQVQNCEADGWFSLPGGEARFRIPNGGDQTAVAGAARPGDELSRRCINPEQAVQKYMQPVQQLLECMAPTLSGPLQGICPECGSLLKCYFDVQSYVISELRDQAQYLYEDVHLLATRYHWTEQEILDLPRQRRFRYVEQIQRD